MNTIYTCKVCGYSWEQRVPGYKKPRACSSRTCASTFWETGDKRKLHHCKKCGHEWKSGTEQPTACNNCHSSLWYTTRKPITGATKGAKNIRWNGGTSAYKDHYQLKKNRLKVLMAANYKCQVCRGEATETHHIDEDKSNHDPNNLMAVCHGCNMRKHSPARVGKKNRRHVGLASIANTVGCSYNTVWRHVTAAKSERFGNAIDQALLIQGDNYVK